MDIIEVDPKLFVTCRLCLEDLGQYQIVPSIQQQIKYCFDIEVDSFDGLPQLICMKCKQILNEFHTVKKTYCEKQTNLKSKTLIKRDEIYVQPQQDTVSSSQQISENIEEPATSTSVKKRSLQPSSSSDFESEHSHLQHTKPKKKKKSLRQRAKHRNRWDADYKKQIACKLCNTLWSSKISLWNHSRAHDLLKTRYKNIFDRPCTVKMEKIDGKPNITGFNNTVVHNSNKITVPGNSFYYTVYLKKNENSNNFSNHSESMEPESLLKKALKQDFTDEDEDIISRPKHRKRRILSRSSNDTVVIESNKVLSDNEMDSRITIHESQDQRSLSNDQCINIDDSSDSESEGKLDSCQKGKQPMAAKLGDYKIIQGIISMCVNAYHKKYESPDVDVSNTTQNKKIDKTQVNSESQLKHKVLSIGRKIINKQGFNCTGLLRYMEHKNLEIVWLSKISYTRETNYIRILTKLRGRDTTNDNHGWVNVAASSSSNKVKVISSSVQDTAASNEKSFANTLKSQFVIKEPNQLTNMEASHIEQVKEQLNLDTMPAMLYVDNNVSNSDPKKLLNANPVANPKQLPKKLSLVNESRINKTPAQPSTSTCHTDNDDNHFMPIITHTTSLATVPIIEDSNHNNNNTTDNSASVIVTNKETTAPRIKVKPASELMSERILNSIMKAQSNPASSDSNMLTSQIENVWPHQQPVNVFVPNLTPQMHIGGQPVQIVQVPCIAPKYQVIQPTPTPTTSTIKQDYVILDTSQFPNAKTESPFQYLKDLLQIHNIILLDPCDELSREFICLIKFKVLFKQEAHQDKPVVLCLGIFNCRNIFCLKVKDRNQEHISINKISANWQWEILQIYRGNVVQKVLNNAQKISKETFDFTNTFFCVLKSINIKKKS